MTTTWGQCLKLTKQLNTGHIGIFCLLLMMHTVLMLSQSDYAPNKGVDKSMWKKEAYRIEVVKNRNVYAEFYAQCRSYVNVLIKKECMYVHW